MAAKRKKKKATKATTEVVVADAPEITYHTKSESGVIREKKQVLVDKLLDRLYNQHNTVTTGLLIEASKDPKSPTHKFFEWDDKVAGNKYREAQAYQMIQASKFVLTLKQQGDGPPLVQHAARPEVRRLVSSFRGGGFKMRNEALSQEDERKVIIQRKLTQLRSWCKETIDIEELKEVRDSVLAELDQFPPDVLN